MIKLGQARRWQIVLLKVQEREASSTQSVLQPLFSNKIGAYPHANLLDCVGNWPGMHEQSPYATGDPSLLLIRRLAGAE